eukprot:GHVT01062417.1.p1 GENE.GHVT01062417.1~~GHVT01062417.1.p1  ORF type:complete len:387 (+),score=51.77 GHVT01062417.1:257-1417(+)
MTMEVDSNSQCVEENTGMAKSGHVPPCSEFASSEGPCVQVPLASSPDLTCDSTTVGSPSKRRDMTYGPAASCLHANDELFADACPSDTFPESSESSESVDLPSFSAFESQASCSLDSQKPASSHFSHSQQKSSFSQGVSLQSSTSTSLGYSNPRNASNQPLFNSKESPFLTPSVSSTLSDAPPYEVEEVSALLLFAAESSIKSESAATDAWSALSEEERKEFQQKAELITFQRMRLAHVPPFPPECSELKTKAEVLFKKGHKLLQNKFPELTDVELFVLCKDAVKTYLAEDSDLQQMLKDSCVTIKKTGVRGRGGRSNPKGAAPVEGGLQGLHKKQPRRTSQQSQDSASDSPPASSRQSSGATAAGADRRDDSDADKEDFDNWNFD